MHSFDSNPFGNVTSHRLLEPVACPLIASKRGGRSYFSVVSLTKWNPKTQRLQFVYDRSNKRPQANKSQESNSFLV